ncbi:MAG: metal ABC transporter ATP-binding protein [Candidatus Bathyarchaeota archaeon]|nr:metal ABC transporter ATP-binding protein [Candidatus Bathyarchaeota archaeon]
MSGNIIYVKDVSVKLKDQIVLDSIGFEVESPSLIVVVGPNGAGKTTLLKTLLGIIKPFRGDVRVLGLNPFKDGVKVRRLVGYVPQKDRVSHETPLKVGDVVLMGILLRKKLLRFISEEDIEAAMKALAYLDMEDKWDSLFSELSGGQQRKVLIARALASDPMLLLLDEVFAGLDLESQRKLLSLLEMLKNKKRTIIVVEHELDPIINIADKILVLNRSICLYGEPHDVLSEDKLKPIYPCLRTIEKEGRRIVILGDMHA